MRKTVLAKEGIVYYKLTQFPELSSDVIASQLEEPCLQALNAVFDSYIEKIETKLNPKTRSKALAHIERIRKSTSKKFMKIVESYAVDISGISPKGFSNVS